MGYISINANLSFTHYDDENKIQTYQYSENKPKLLPAANREGFGHIAFEVDDIAEIIMKVLSYGGSKIGEVVSSEVVGVGMLTFIYLADPEGNIIELQAWK